MTAPAPVTPNTTQQVSVSRCLTRLADVLGVNPTGFDVPCGCGHRSDLCTMRDDGTCDG